MSPLQRQERSVQNEKCGRCKSREDSPLKSQGFPEHVPVAERLEPEHVHVIGQRGPSAKKMPARTARMRRKRRRRGGCIRGQSMDSGIAPSCFYKYFCRQSCKRSYCTVLEEDDY